MQVPLGPEDRTCPFHQKAMSKVCHKCPLWVNVRGKNPQGPDFIDNWNCAFAWMPLMLVEVAQRSMGTTAAVESFRNEVAMNNEAVNENIKNQLANESMKRLA